LVYPAGLVHRRSEIIGIHRYSAAKEQTEGRLEKGGTRLEDLRRKYEVADESAGGAYRHYYGGGLEVGVLGWELGDLAVVMVVYLLHLPSQAAYPLLLLLMRQLVMVI